MVLTLVLVLSAAAPVLAQKDDQGEDEGNKPLATAKHEEGLVVEVLEVRPDKAKDLLTIRWRYKNPTDKAVVIVKSGRFVTPSGVPWQRFVSNTYFLQAGDDTTYRYFIVKDTGGKYWATPKIGPEGYRIKPGQEVEFWAKFARPKKAKISLHLPDVPPIEDLPVQKKAS
jgi:hypothetical protein